MSAHPSDHEVEALPFQALPLRAQRKLSKREQIRIALRTILSCTWQPLWRATRRFDKAWYALLLGGALAFGQLSHSAPSHANGSGVVANDMGAGMLLIQGTVGDDQVVLTVENGELKVNGRNPNTGVLLGSEVQNIYIEMADGADTINLSALRRADLGADPRVFSNTGGGDDLLTLSPDIGGSFVDGSGNDTLMITVDGEIIYSDGGASVNNVAYTFNGFFEQAMISGGAGNDTLNAQFTHTRVTLNGGGGNDEIYGSMHGGGVFQVSSGNDALYNTSSSRVELTADSDMTLDNNGITWGVNSATFNGFPELVLLTGGAGKNTIDASNYSGMVQLDGAGGDDTLVGGSGSTTITGGAGADTVVSSAGSTQITDPSVADGDRLKLEGVFFADAQVIGDMNKIIWMAAENQIVPHGTVFNGLFSEVSLIGTDANNTFLFGSYAGRTALSGLGGDDTLNAGQGGGILDGGAGDDTLAGGSGADEFRPGAGQNSLSDETADDGDVLVYTGSGTITLDATMLTTPDGTSTFNGFFEAALLTGGAGADTINASGFTGSATLRGLGGNDTLVDGSGDDVLEGGDGNDTIFVSLGNDTVDAGAGDDLVERTLTPPTGAMVQTAGNDTLDGGAGVDILVQQADGTQTLTDTQLTGLGTAAISNFEEAELTGGAGDDTIDASGFTGSATLRGLGGDDTLTDGNGDDLLEGGDGNDTIFVSFGNDMVNAGAGDDRVEWRTTSPVIAAPPTMDNDIFDGGDGVDTLVQQANGTQTLTDSQLTGLGTAAISNFEAAELTGGAGDDTIDASGFSGNVVLRGLDGNDTLIGSQGDSVIEGGAGEDTITSGAGQNTIDGGPDVDTIDGVVEGGVEQEVFTVYIPYLER